MKTIHTHTTRKANTSTATRQIAALADEIKLGIDQHAGSYRIVRMIDGATPQPALRLSPEQMPDYVQKQLAQAKKVYSCYEAGPCGFNLHRLLTDWGVTNYVICPMRLDEQNKRVNNDKTDARELTLRLDRYVHGNKKAFSIVRVPTIQEEERRLQSRQRDQLAREKRRLAAMGRSLLLTAGFRRKGDWWKKSAWKHLQGLLSPAVRESLEIWSKLIVAVEEQLAAVSKKVEAQAPAVRPKGLGALTLASLTNEVCDWKRFDNRKQVASYTGLCGGVSSTGETYYDLPITKHGNGRMRWMLIQLAWRMVIYQSQSKSVQKWKHILLQPKAHVRAKKRAIVAVARQLAVDLWRWQTSRVTPEQLDWIMLKP